MKPACSMTGFAAVSGELANGVRFTLTMKSVNHRFLDMQFRMPPGCDALEMEIRKQVKERLRRGHVAVGLQVDDSSTRVMADYNREAAARGVRAMRTAMEELGLQGRADGA